MKPMPKYYTPDALAALDDKVCEAQKRHDEALLSLGDDSGSSETWHDNPVFEQAKRDVDATRSTLRKLQNIRADAVPLVRESPAHVVDVGTTVVVSISDHEDEAEVRTFHIAGHYVAARSHDSEVFQLATASPLGVALVGKTEGSKASYVSPNGKTYEATVVKIVG
jgi:transcription elongation GreA/GreB family factor